MTFARMLEVARAAGAVFAILQHSFIRKEDVPFDIMDTTGAIRALIPDGAWWHFYDKDDPMEGGYAPDGNGERAGLSVAFFDDYFNQYTAKEVIRLYGYLVYPYEPEYDSLEEEEFELRDLLRWVIDELHDRTIVIPCGETWFIKGFEED